MLALTDELTADEHAAIQRMIQQQQRHTMTLCKSCGMATVRLWGGIPLSVGRTCTVCQECARLFYMIVTLPGNINKGPQ